MLRNIILILAILFLLESISFSLSANLTLGLALLWLITVSLFIGAVFYQPIAAFLSSGIGIWIKRIGILGIVLYVGMMAFLGLAASFTQATGNEQAIVVLGAGLNGNEVSGTLRRRLDAALAFAGQNPDLPIVVTGGQGQGELRTEASAMKEYLINKGVPADRILLEDKSTSTRENFLFAQRVLAENGYENIREVAFVTNRFHCYRASLIARRTGLQPAAVPATISITAALPCYLREVPAVLYYWFIRRS